MRMSRRVSVLFAAVLGALSFAGPSFADPGETDVLSSALEAHRLALEFDGANLRGPGAERLLADARAAQFVLVGEDHGFAETPAFVQALYRDLVNTPDRYRALAIEVGPLSAARVEEALHRDRNALAQTQALFPFALPFLAWRENAALATSVVREDGGAELWGVDQEFLLSSRMHFMRLADLAPTPDARQMAQDYARRDREAYRTMVEKHDPQSTLLTHLTQADFDGLRKAFTGAKPGALAIVDALEESARIYRSQESDSNVSNRARALLMKRNFMASYAPLAQRDGKPRVLFQMGAYHLGRGLSPTRQFDLGNLVSELAASRAEHSYHVLVLAAGGEVNHWFPFLPDAAAKKAPYAAAEELETVGAKPLLGKVLPRKWTLFDLVALRDVPGIRKAGGPEFARLLDAYDAVVLMDTAHAAHFLGD